MMTSTSFAIGSRMRLARGGIVLGWHPMRQFPSIWRRAAIAGLLVASAFTGMDEARAQAANQCSAANSLPLINAPEDSGWIGDNSPGITHTPTLNANTATTRYGTQANGAIRVAGELQWNNSNGPNSGRATMEIFVNGG